MSDRIWLEYKHGTIRTWLVFTALCAAVTIFELAYHQPWLMLTQAILWPLVTAMFVDSYRYERETHRMWLGR